MKDDLEQLPHLRDTGDPMNKRELQRLADDPEIMEAVETLREWGVNGNVYDKLIKQARYPGVLPT